MTTEQVQHLLAYLSIEYRRDALHPVYLDGIPGQKTEAAIRDFQSLFGGLTVKGRADEATTKALRHAVAYGIEIPETAAEIGLFWDEIPNFTRDEFKCKCGGKYCNGFPAEPQEAMVRIAQAARDHFGEEGIVISGLRCPQWNAIQGGVENSQHMYGEACDIYIQRVPGATVLEWFLKQPGVRYAYQIQGSQNVHFDIPKGDR